MIDREGLPRVPGHGSKGGGGGEARTPPLSWRLGIKGSPRSLRFSVSQFSTNRVLDRYFSHKKKLRQKINPTWTKVKVLMIFLEFRTRSEFMLIEPIRFLLSKLGYAGPWYISLLLEQLEACRVQISAF